MGNRYTIAETGKLLTELLREILGKEMEIPPEKIVLGTPGEDHQALLCVFPYDIKRSAGEQFGQKTAVGEEMQRYPSAFYDLYYMLIPYSDSDIRYRMEEEMRFMDILLRGLGDTGYLLEDTQVEVLFHGMGLEEKTRLWNGLNQPLRPALYCRVGPVEVTSDRMENIRRVKDIRMRYADRREE